jgi:hypothetical protein
VATATTAPTVDAEPSRKKKTVMNILKTKPAAVSAALVALLNALVLLHVIDLSGEQIGGINVAIAAVLGLFVHQSVTPVANVVAYTSHGHAVAGAGIDSIPTGESVQVQRVLEPVTT